MRFVTGRGWGADFRAQREPELPGELLSSTLWVSGELLRALRSACAVTLVLLESLANGLCQLPCSGSGLHSDCFPMLYESDFGCFDYIFTGCLQYAAVYTAAIGRFAA